MLISFKKFFLIILFFASLLAVFNFAMIDFAYTLDNYSVAPVAIPAPFGEDLAPLEYAVTEADNSMSETAKTALKGMKKKYEEAGKFEDIKDSVKTVIVPGGIEEAGGLEGLKSILAKNKKVIFLSLPDINDKELMNTLGIESVSEKKEKKGMDFAEGFFIGGKFSLEYITWEVRDITLLGGTKVYAYAGEKGGQTPLIWRTYFGDSMIFVVNGSFLEEAGAGVLAAILSKTEDVFIYPIVNAKAVYFDNFPIYDKYGDTTMLPFYNRSIFQFVKEIMWPGLVSVQNVSDTEFTFVTGDFSKEETETADFFNRQFLKEGSHLEKNVATKAITQGYVYEENQDLIMRSSVTFNGYISHLTDLSIPINAEDNTDDWSLLQKDLQHNFSKIIKPYKWIQKLSGESTYIKYENYKNIRPIPVITNNQLTVEAGTYILRTNKKVKPINGTDILLIEKDVYLIFSAEDEVKIQLTD